MKRKIIQTPGFAACTFEIKADGKRVQLLQAGSFRSTDEFTPGRNMLRNYGGYDE